MISAEAETTSTGTAAPIGWLLAAVIPLVFGTNLLGVLVPILGHERGSGMVAIGLFSSAWSLGFIAASAVFGVLLHRLGHVRAFGALAIIGSMAALGFLRWPPDRAWIALRLFGGFCYGGGAAIVEAWILEGSATDRAFARYMVANLIASLLGTLSLDVVQPDGKAPFLLAGAALALALVPMICGAHAAPPRPRPFRPDLGALLRRSPLGAVGCLIAGLVIGAVGGLGPVFGAMAGLDMQADTTMLAAASVGGAAGYVLSAWLAVRSGRRSAVLLFATGGAAVCALIVLLGPAFRSGVLIALLFALGLALYPLYGQAVGIACEQAHDRPVPAVSSECLLVFGAGTIAGPLIGGQIMRTGAANLFAMVGGLLLVMSIVVLSGRVRPPADPVD